MDLSQPPHWLDEVMPWLSLPEIGRMTLLSKGWNAIGDDEFWNRQTERLVQERRLYLSPNARQSFPSSHAMFLDLWQQRDRFVTDEEAKLIEEKKYGKKIINDIINKETTTATSAAAPAAADVDRIHVPDGGEEEDEEQQVAGKKKERMRFSISVCVRFKRQDPSAASSSDENINKTVLPLHQVLKALREEAKKRPVDPWAKSQALLTEKQEEEVVEEESSSSSSCSSKSSVGDEDQEAQQAVEGEDDEEVPIDTAASAGYITAPPSDDESSDDEDDDESKRNAKSAADAVAAAATMQVGVLALRPKTASVLAVAPGVGLRSFNFHHVFPETASQSEVYTSAAQKLVMDFLNGFNATILVYGQTGSGKTHTMFGSDEYYASAAAHPDDSPQASPLRSTVGTEAGKMRNLLHQHHHSYQHRNPHFHDRGIIPRACEEILRGLKERQRAGFSTQLAVSFVEIYGNEVSDLLRQGRIVGQSRVAGQRYVLEGHSEMKVNSMREIRELLVRGNAQKRRAATAMNERSSRSHTVFVLTLIQTDLREQQQQDENGIFHPAIQFNNAEGSRQVASRFMLVDLGGSEKISKSKVDEGTHLAGTVSWDEYYRERQRQREAIYINAGLFALKKCIDALNRREEAVAAGEPVPYVPYQDSKLTMLLSGALGGDARTCVLVAGALDKQHGIETIQTLRFGESCGKVQNTATVSTAALAAALRSLDLKIQQCEDKIRSEERWENITELRQDLEGVERVTRSVLVGGEKHRAELELLLKEKQRLLEGV